MMLLLCPDELTLTPWIVLAENADAERVLSTLEPTLQHGGVWEMRLELPGLISASDPLIGGELRSVGVGALHVVRVCSGDKTTGLLAIGYDDSPPVDTEALARISRQLATALERRGELQRETGADIPTNTMQDGTALFFEVLDDILLHIGELVRPDLASLLYIVGGEIRVGARRGLTDEVANRNYRGSRPAMVVETGKPIIVDDTDRSSTFVRRDEARVREVRSLAYLPILNGENVICVVIIGMAKRFAYTNNTVKKLREILDRYTIRALDALAEAELAQQRTLEAVTLRVGQLAVSLATLDDFCSDAAHIVGEALGATVIIASKHDAALMIDCAAEIGNEGFLEKSGLGVRSVLPVGPGGDPETGRIILDGGRPIGEGERPSLEFVSPLGYGPTISVPLLAEGDAFGILHASRRREDRAFDRGEVRFIRGIANQIATVYRRESYRTLYHAEATSARLLMQASEAMLSLQEIESVLGHVEAIAQSALLHCIVTVVSGPAISHAAGVTAPILIDGHPVGHLLVLPKPNVRISGQDRWFVEALVRQASASLHNQKLVRDLRAAFATSAQVLVDAVEAKDPYTAGHSHRVARHALDIAIELDLERGLTETVTLAGMIHDIGKLGVPDAILSKTSRLDPAERTIMMSHPVIGSSILEGSGALANLLPAVRYHHEFWSGEGYPDHLTGTDIPLTARIVQIADTFDAITSARSYKKVQRVEVAIDEFKKYRERQFCPDCVDAFVAVLERDTAAEAPYLAAIDNHADRQVTTSLPLAFQ